MVGVLNLPTFPTAAGGNIRTDRIRRPGLLVDGEDAVQAGDVDGSAQVAVDVGQDQDGLRRCRLAAENDEGAEPGRVAEGDPAEVQGEPSRLLGERRLYGDAERSDGVEVDLAADDEGGGGLVAGAGGDVQDGVIHPLTVVVVRGCRHRKRAPRWRVAVGAG